MPFTRSDTGHHKVILTAADGSRLGITEGHECARVVEPKNMDQRSEQILFIEPVNDDQCRIYSRDTFPYNYMYEPRPLRTSYLINENAQVLQNLLTTGGLAKVAIRTTLSQRLVNVFSGLFNAKAAETVEITPEKPHYSNVIPLERPKALANS